MENSIQKLLPVVLLLVFHTAFSQSTSVTFKVNMNEQVALEKFDPATEFVDIAGSFNNWGAPNGLLLSDEDNDGIYTANQILSVGEGIELKARINGEWNGREEFSVGGSNRQLTIEENAIIEFWYNDELPDNILQVNISASTNFGLPGEVIQFTDQSNGNPISWEWSFPNGTPSTSNDQNPIVTYANEGKYDVSLTIANEEGETISKIFENYITIGTQDTYWWNDAVFYEIFVRSFYDADGDGIGDFKGLTEKLDYLNDGNPATQQDLGITGIWLMPIQQSPSYHGYDVTDYRSIENDYGSNEDFKAFIAAAHERGIKVIIDYVMNHSSTEHPWFIDSENSTNNKREWYVWEDTSPGDTGPWGQNVWHQSNGDYYYGLFWGGMPDLNYETPAVKEEMFDIASFWLEEMNIDGFRLDAVKYIYETEAGLEDTEETFQFWKDFRTHYKSVNPDAFAVGEAWSATEKAKKYVDSDGLDYVFEFDLAGNILGAVNNGNASGLIAKSEEVMGSYPYLQFGSFLTNHDMDRVMNVLGENEDKARQAAELLFSLPGIPYIYYGEEIGMLGAKPDEDIRLPLQWSSASHAGFTNGTPWRAPKADFTDKNIQNQQIDPQSLWRSYHQLISTRNSQIALRRGNYRTVETGDNGVYSFLRQYENEHVLVVANVSGSPKTGVQISSTNSGIAAGEYQLVDLLSGESESIIVQAGSSFTHQLNEIPAQTTRIYKLLDEENILTNVELMVDMNDMIESESFDPQTETVILISNQNDFGSDEKELVDEDGDGIYKVILNDKKIGSAFEYKYGINLIGNGREEFPESDYLRTYRLKESENAALDIYNQKGSAITSVEKPESEKLAFMLFPNPADNFITIQWEASRTKLINYQIIDATGKVSAKGVISASANKINVANLPQGLYIFQLKTNNDVFSQKFIIGK
ncbi:T9SS type A sorting domain-containing protein [Marivirga sp. S37H4]|uniref:T9SS type A sorting domain-containing protein n=1 Tax=Marivirga aurantiaca TaxID=2802615 RepID=A0A934X0J8_9BACT|nr:alpha-amylase family glycosyl hydrolase [Marivirga aurantiaca]MBK6266708.1 T9SS type A sorting domain-containing protein [Marivirga aurantiaca]